MNNLLPKCSRLALALGALMLIACSPAAMSVQPVTADSANATRAATSPLVTPDSATATRATSATAPIATRVQTAPADSGANAPSPASVGYAIVDTGQGKCYNNSQETTCPQPGQPFYGQDAHYVGRTPAYKNNGDGTITDQNTGLMWQKTPGAKVTYASAVAGAKSLNLAGYNDWRLPTIKELYSLILFSGTDVSGCANANTCNATPFLDTKYFDFQYGNTSAGERMIDAQYWSSTEYGGTTMGGNATVFGVNFADGRIKGYPRGSPRGEMTQFVRYVRGNPNYGVNDFVAAANGVITDRATGLMWVQADSGNGMNWQAALAWVHQKNAENYLGYNDWRLPNAKELQSIVDYTRAPATTKSAAINSLFSVTTITDEGGKANYPFYWTGTTHADSRNGGTYAVYVCFGECLGYMQAQGGNYTLMDVHGAGAQRSDPKTGNPADYPHGHGPQGDVVRIANYVRLVRGGNVTATVPSTTPSAPIGGQQPSSGQQPPSCQQQPRTSQQQPPTGQQQPPSNQQPGNRAGGRVTAVNGNIIALENPQGKETIATNAGTRFVVNGQAGSFASVAVGKFIEATGQRQSDGSFLATQVTISDTPPARPQSYRPEGF